jgi:FAD-dependent urate hydroxylase
MTDVLIVGAGVGGLAAASGLLADGHGVRVLEAAQRLRVGGAAVTIFPNGHAALHRLGIYATDLGGRIEAMEFRDAAGRRLSRIDLAPVVTRTGFPVTTVPRAALLTRLVDQVPPGTVVYGAAVDEVDPGAAGTTVTDRMGSVRTADVLVGADGQGSVVRRAVVDPRAPVPSGWTTWQGLSPVLPELANGTCGVFFVGAAGLCGLMPAGHGLLQWWFDTPAAEGESSADDDVADDDVPARLRTLFCDYPEPVGALLDAVAGQDVGRFPHVTHEVLDVWGRETVTLLGDAAHAFPPSQAQGANQALEDAWALTRALRGRGEVRPLLRAYERGRVPAVRRISRMAASEITNRPPNLPTRAVAGLVPPRLAGLGYLKILRRFSDVLAVTDA